jgi:hypothetical protein
MKSTGKISVTYFLNKNVRPEPSHPMFPLSERFPLYIQVTYNRRNTQFRSFYHGFYSSIEDAYFGKENREHREYEESLIKKVVEYEAKHFGKEFKLKGLKDRYNNYSANIFSPIDKYFRDLIYNAVIKTDSEFKEILDPWKMQQISFHVYFNAASKLINDLDKKLPNDFKEEMKLGLYFLKWVDSQNAEVRLIDWLDHSAIIAIEVDLRKGKQNEIQIKNLIDFVNRIIKISTGLKVY